MKELIVNSEDITVSNITLYTQKKNGKVNILHPKTTADQVMMSDEVNIEDKLIGMSADIYQAAQTAVEAFSKANAAFDALPNLNGYVTTQEMNTALAAKAGTAIATTTAAGLCPKLGGGTTNFLRADGTWATPPDTNTTYSAVTQETAGLMSAADKQKLDGIAAGATNTPNVTVSSLFPNPNATPACFAVFNSSYADPGYLPVANAKILLKPDLMTGASTNAAGTSGLVPAPPTGAVNRYLCSDGTWKVLANINATDLGYFGGLELSADTPYIDFHFDNKSTTDFTSRIMEMYSGVLVVLGTLMNRNIRGMYSSGFDFGTTPTSNLNTTDYFLCGKSGNASEYVSYIQSAINTANTVAIYLGLRSNKTSGAVSSNIGIKIDNDDVVRTFAPSPPSADDSTQIATTEWTRARIAAATGKGATTFSLSPDIDTLALDDFCDWSPDMVTKDMLEAAKKVINEYSTQAIFYGFWYELNDENYFFTYDLYDQQNFSDNAILALSGEDTSLPARTEMNEMVKINFSSSEMLALHKYALKTHKQTYMNLSLERKNEIVNIQSETELKEKMGEYDLLEEYEAYMESINTTYLSEMDNV